MAEMPSVMNTTNKFSPLSTMEDENDDNLYFDNDECSKVIMSMKKKRVANLDPLSKPF